MEDCLFCKIIKGEIPSTKVYEDEYVYAFNDIEPQAPYHVILVPKKHISSANELNVENSMYVAKIFEVIPQKVLPNIKPDAAIYKNPSFAQAISVKTTTRNTARKPKKNISYDP